MITRLLLYFIESPPQIDKETEANETDIEEDTNEDANADADDLLIILKETKLDNLISQLSNTSISHSNTSISQATQFIDQPQYGTSFGDAVDFYSTSTIKSLHYTSDLPEINAYHAKVNEFYLPSLNKYYPLHQPVPRQPYQYAIDEKRQQINYERTKLQVPSLTPAQVHEVALVLQNPHHHQKIKSNFNIDLAVHDFRTLGPGQWLNDKIIDYYFNLIAGVDPQYHSWTSHFFTNLQSRGYAGVKRWGRRLKLNIFDKRVIFIPININSTHWALSIINNHEKTISYLDSLVLKGGNPGFLKLIKAYMEGETERLGVSIDVGDYKLVPNYTVPQQRNGYDCGVFTCAAAVYIAQGHALSYTQGDMARFRQRMAWEILHDQLL